MTMAHQTPLPYYHHGHGTGPALVLLHYWGDTSRTWGPVLDRLPEHEVLTLDFRGWGRSNGLPGPYTLRQLADDTLAVIAHARISDYVLVGHSMGGKVAQLVAATRPEGLRSIVLVGSGPAKPPAAITPEYQEGLAHAYDSDESAAWARDNILTATELPEMITSQVVADSRSAHDAARAEWPLHGIAEDITEQARMISVPALVIAGEKDQVEPLGVLRDNLVPYLSDARLVEIPATGHLIPLEAPDALAHAIASFTTAG